MADNIMKFFRLKDDQLLVKGDDYKKMRGDGDSSDSVSKIKFNIAPDSAGTYKCRGTQYDQYCAAQKNFESDGVVLTVISATELENPADGTAYGSGTHTFSCRFPNPFPDDPYEINWSFKGVDDAAAKVCDMIRSASF